MKTITQAEAIKKIQALFKGEIELAYIEVGMRLNVREIDKNLALFATCHYRYNDVSSNFTASVYSFSKQALTIENLLNEVKHSINEIVQPKTRTEIVL